MERVRKYVEKLRKQIRYVFTYYINGTKGVISLFLAMLMLPFLSMALMLTEATRYQHAIELMNELMDTAILSSEAEYDSYLESRFALMSFDQDTNPKDSFSKYLEKNAETLGGNVTLKSSSAEAVYPLADKEVFKEQIIEFSQVSVPVKLGEDLLNIKDVIDNFYKKIGVDGLNKYAEATNEVASLADNAAKLVKAVEDAEKEFQKYSTQLTEYQNAASNFHTKTQSLIDAVHEAETDLLPDVVYEEISVVGAVTAANTARNDYSREAGEMNVSLGKMREAIKKIMTTVNSLTQGGVSTNTAIEATPGMTAAETAVTTKGEWAQRVIAQISKTITDSLGQTWEQDIRVAEENLLTQKTNIGYVYYGKPEDNPPSTRVQIYGDTDINQSWFTSKYDALNLSGLGISGDVFSALKRTASSFNETGDMGDEGKSKLEKLLDLMESILDIDFMYDGALDSAVDTSRFYNVSGGQNFSSEALITSIQSIVSGANDYKNGVNEKNPLKKLGLLLVGVGKVLFGVAAFVVYLVAAVVNIVATLIDLVVNLPNLWRHLLLYGYGVYACPSRTTYASGTSITGSKFSAIFNMFGGNSSNGVSGALSDIEKLSKGGGSDQGFKGAELEYLLQGNPNELANQTATALNLFITRMACNFSLIQTDPTVQTVALALTPLEPVVYVVWDLLESFIDVLFLVNGVDSYLIKSSLYLSATGIYALAQDLPKMTNISKAGKAEIQDFFNSKMGKTTMKGTYKASYNEYCLILLLATVKEDTFITRLQNLVQMESKKKKDSFTLDKAYTTLKGTATYNLNSLFSFDSLDGPFNIHTTRYGSY